MYRIRFHGRGGQGMKTASRILGSAFFAEGFEVQDAPSYGAERRGAPIFATVRAAHAPILERGPMPQPGLVIVADETLLPMAAGGGVLSGMGERAVLLLHSAVDANTWKQRLQLACRVLTLPLRLEETGGRGFVGALCAGAAARLVGIVSREALEGAIRQELAAMPAQVLAANLKQAGEAYDAMKKHAGCVCEAPEAPAPGAVDANWIDLPFEAAELSAPDIHGALTSIQVRTGLWRTLRPVIDPERCSRCHWLCGSLCPDAAISPEAEGLPVIDYEHCKGCLVCVAVCPRHAIESIPEAQAREQEASP
ncbi:MAG: 2-oxoacid:acceptor oxidoreductase family protein [Deltaproteobacteria bacterium]|nr:2-oxoacid:acceptor oxidoreductase family protein [Deltaproteobacteria bacterium]